MLFSIYLLLSTLSSAYAASSPPASDWDIEYLAALIDNTYCTTSKYTRSGYKLGNATLLTSLAYSERYDQRVDFYQDPDYGIVVAYEGTNSTSSLDWLHDIDLIHTSSTSDLGINSSAKIHQGFLNQHERVWPQVKSTLANYLSEDPKTTVTVIGHSMGGSICQLAALAIENTFGPGTIGKIVAYAPVRTGDPTYAAAFNEKFKDIYLGVWNGRDWVPWIMRPSLGYEHPENMLWFNPENTTTYMYYENAEDPSGPSGHAPKITSGDTAGGTSELLATIYQGDLYDAITPTFGALYWGAHVGVYMRTELYSALGERCPATVGGH